METQPKIKPVLGCHSDLDKYKKTERPPCDYANKATERACEGCKRK